MSDFVSPSRRQAQESHERGHESQGEVDQTGSSQAGEGVRQTGEENELQGAADPDVSRMGHFAGKVFTQTVQDVVTLDMQNGSQLIWSSHVNDYALRGNDLAHLSILDFVQNTYEQPLPARDSRSRRCMDNDALMQEQVGPG